MAECKYPGFQALTQTVMKSKVSKKPVCSRKATLRTILFYPEDGRTMFLRNDTDNQQVTLCHKPEENMNIHHCENLES
jgi:hypothetical protein